MNQGTGRTWRRSVWAAMIVTGIGAGAAEAQASDFTVTSTADEGQGSLRAQIEAANLAAGADRILFQSTVTGTIELQAPLPEVTGTLEIKGPGSDVLAIDGGGDVQIFELSADTAISDLTITGGYAESTAGAIEAGEALAIDRMLFEDNRSGTWGGAIFARGDLDVTDSAFTGNYGEWGGGALATGQSPQTISIGGSSFSGNSADGGGGAILFLGGYPTTIEDSTFADNAGVGNGGAVSFYDTGTSRISGSTFTGNHVMTDTGYNSGRFHGGGALFANLQMGPLLRVENSTFTGNDSIGGSGGAIFLRGGDADLDSLTVVDNTALPGGFEFEDQAGGGIHQLSYTSELTNSIVAANESSASGDLGGGESSPLSPAGRLATGHSLIGDPGTAFVDAAPDTNLIGDDPRLGPLADNGGPTPTMLPEAASPVLDHGLTALELDQRGFARRAPRAAGTQPAPGSDGSDMGAVERATVPGPTGPTGPTDPTGPTGPTSPTGPTGPTGGGVAFAGLKLNRKTGVATLSVKVPGAGQVTLAGSKTVAKQAKRANGPATIKLAVRAKGKAAKTLRKKGTVKVGATVTYAPAAGRPSKLTRNVKLVKKKPKKRR